MRMVIVTSMDELQEGDHLVSEEIYKAIMILLMGWTHEPDHEHIFHLSDDYIAKIENAGNTITASEGLFGFMAWLTSFENPVIFSENHSASVAVNLITEWIKINHLSEPRINWTDYIEQPPKH